MESAYYCLDFATRIRISVCATVWELHMMKIDWTLHVKICENRLSSNLLGDDHDNEDDMARGWLLGHNPKMRSGRTHAVEDWVLLTPPVLIPHEDIHEYIDIFYAIVLLYHATITERIHSVIVI